VILFHVFRLIFYVNFSLADIGRSLLHIIIVIIIMAVYVVVLIQFFLYYANNDNSIQFNGFLIQFNNNPNTITKDPSDITFSSVIPC
jgi:hypothetical protein